MEYQSMTHHGTAAHRRGFTLVEVLVVVAVVVILLSVLAYAMSGVRNSSLMTASQSNMRQIYTWMQLYADDNRDTILPSQFDYQPEIYDYKGKVRNNITPQEGMANEGTWTDILWTVYEIDTLDFMVGPAGHDYTYDSPDALVYEVNDTYDDSPLRAAATNTRDVTTPSGTYPPDPTALPWGDGARENGYPGFFAANDYFNARGSDSMTPAPDRYTRDDMGNYTISTPPPPAGRWHSNGQLQNPTQAMYLVDSFAGEVIQGEYDPAFAAAPEMYTHWYNVEVVGGTPVESWTPGIVDFRYNNSALMLFLDGHIAPQSQWYNLDQLENVTGTPGQRRNVQVTRLSGE